MKTLSTLFATVATLGLLTGCAGVFVKKPAPDDNLSGPYPPPYGEKVIQLSAPPGLTLLQVRQSILNAAIERGWDVIENGMVDGADGSEAGLVRLRMRNYFYETNLLFLFNPSVVEGYSDSYVLNSKGERTKRYTPPLRVSGIRDEIKDFLRTQVAGF